MSGAYRPVALNRSKVAPKIKPFFWFSSFNKKSVIILPRRINRNKNCLLEKRSALKKNYTFEQQKKNLILHQVIGMDKAFVINWVDVLGGSEPVS